MKHIGMMKALRLCKTYDLMKLENAELKHIERIVAISKAVFDSDI